MSSSQRLHIHGTLPQQHQRLLAFFVFENLVALSILICGRNRLNEESKGIVNLRS